jgi:hypothetical protein
VEFYSEDGVRLGDKGSLQRQIHEVTGIPVKVLQGSPLSEITVEERLQWVEARQTTEEDDKSYCLLEIFSVTMLLNYGEGEAKAMKRLLKRSKTPKRPIPNSQV